MPWNTVFKLWEVFENGVIEQERQYLAAVKRKGKLYPSFIHALEKKGEGWGSMRKETRPYFLLG